jgi:hypothetical protein
MKQFVSLIFVILIIVNVQTAWASAAEGVVYWNTDDKQPNVSISGDGLSIGVSGNVLGGVRGNRAFNPGEGFYYFEVESHVTAAASIGVVTGEYAFGESIFANDNVAVWNGNASPGLVVGVAVDYRGYYPVIHLVTGDENGVNYYSSKDLDQVQGPIYIFMQASNVSETFQHTLNVGATPFVLDYAQGIQQGIYRGHVGIEHGWPTDNEHPAIQIIEGNTAQLAGSVVSLSASANDIEDGDISASTQWFLDGVLIGMGPTAAFSPAAGKHRVVAVANDSVGNKTESFVHVTMVTDTDTDQDFDGLSFAQEVGFGSNPGLRDSDEDGLADGDELNNGTNILNADTDSDGMTDGYEVNHGLDPLVIDATSDLDGDSFVNLDEYMAGRKANDANDFPGHGSVVFNASDASVGISLTNSGLTASIGLAVGGVRSDVSIAPESGWHYFEASREQYAPIGDFGFGVANDSAQLDSILGVDANSLVVSTSGELRFNGNVVATLDDPSTIYQYGLAIDYTGTVAIAHVVAATPYDDYQVLTGINLGSIGDLHILAWGASPDSSVISLNAGASKNTLPFTYNPNYLLHRAGYDSAETLRAGWGDAYVYTPVRSMPLKDEVYLVKERRINPAITMSEDRLSVSYFTPHKSAILANQGMIGEFWYWEAQRHVEIGNFGFGLNNPYAYLDPYCCVNNGLEGAPPSMSINALGSVWRNLQYQFGYPRQTEAEYYGYAVDYRGARPIVYIISLDGVVGQLVMDDFITPIYPQLYGEKQLEVERVNSANFGASSFYYNAAQALKDYGVDVSELQLGWGVHQTSEHQGFGADAEAVIEVSTASENLLVLGQTLSLQAVATDFEDGDISASIIWVEQNSGAIWNGDVVDVTLPPGDYIFISEVTDSAGRQVQSIAVMLSVEEPVAPDTDGDGVNDAVEAFFGTSINDTDSDDDGLSDGEELYEFFTDPLSNDTDADGMSDEYEVSFGLNATFDDASEDFDADGYSNAVEFASLSNPSAILSYPGSPETDIPYLAAVGEAFDASAVTFDGNEYSLMGSGEDFFNTDGYQFIYSPISGNGEIIARVTSFPSSIGGKAGLMVRESLNAGSAQVLLALSAQGTSMYARESLGAQRTELFEYNSWYAKPPYYLRLLKEGTLVTGYRSANGSAWAVIFSQTVTLEDGYMGIFIGANDAGATQSAILDTVSFTEFNETPELILGAYDLTALLNENIALSATASDYEDGDITSDIVWTSDVSVASGLGATFQYTPDTIGIHSITALVEDSTGAIISAVASIQVLESLGSLDDDNDGLTNNEEVALGTNPSDADSDGDGVIDGDEVHLYGSDPLNIDTDSDGLPDGYEVAQGYDPTVIDSAMDSDGDGVSNLDEYLAGTDPNDVYDYPGAPIPSLTNGVVIGQGTGSFTAQGENYQLTSDTVSISGTTNQYFTYTTLPTNGEAIVRLSSLDGGQFGRAGLMIRDGLDLNSAYALVAMTEGLGTGMFWVDSTNSASTDLNEWNSWYIDEPYWLRLARADDQITGYRSADGIAWTEIATASVNFTGDIYIGVSFSANYPGLDGTVNFNEFSLSLNNDEPSLTLSGTSNAMLLTDTLSLSAVALDSEDGDISGQVSWEGGAVTGANYDFTPSVLGEYTLTASITDSLGGVASTSTTFTVVNDFGDLDDDNDGLTNNEEVALGTNPSDADSDGDGVIDGDEVHLYGSDPLNIDTDSDGLPDGYEVAQGYDPTVIDSAMDSDGDGVSNLDEYLAGTDPNDVYDYPGAPIPSLTNGVVIGQGTGSFTAQGENYQLTSDTVSISGTTNQYFTYTTLPTNGEAIVRLSSLDGGQSGRAGLMIRDGLDLNSAYALVGMTEGRGTGMFWVDSTDGTSTDLNEWNQWYANEPYWFRLVRADNQITGYRSADGIAWTEIATVSVNFTGDIYIGVSFSANNLGLDAAVTFENFELLID